MLSHSKSRTTKVHTGQYTKLRPKPLTLPQKTMDISFSPCSDAKPKHGIYITAVFESEYLKSRRSNHHQRHPSDRLPPPIQSTSLGPSAQQVQVPSSQLPLSYLTGPHTSVDEDLDEMMMLMNGTDEPGKSKPESVALPLVTAAMITVIIIPVRVAWSLYNAAIKRKKKKEDGEKGEDRPDKDKTSETQTTKNQMKQSLSMLSLGEAHRNRRNHHHSHHLHRVVPRVESNDSLCSEISIQSLSSTASGGSQPARFHRHSQPPHDRPDLLMSSVKMGRTVAVTSLLSAPWRITENVYGVAITSVKRGKEKMQALAVENWANLRNAWNTWHFSIVPANC